MKAAIPLRFCGAQAWAQEEAQARKGRPRTKVVLENDKVRVDESTFRPGDQSPIGERKTRVSHAIKGGTELLTYPDGRTAKVEIKTGETRWLEKSTLSVKNVGKTDIFSNTTGIK